MRKAYIAILSVIIIAVLLRQCAFIEHKESSGGYYFADNAPDWTSVHWDTYQIECGNPDLTPSMHSRAMRTYHHIIHYRVMVLTKEYDYCKQSRHAANIGG